MIESTTTEDEYVAVGNVIQPQYALYMIDGIEAIIDTDDTLSLCNDTAQGGSGTILSVNITWDFYTAGTHDNDHFDLEYGIGTDCNTGAPGSWTGKLEVNTNLGDDTTHHNHTANVTGDRSWTWADITNIWIRVDGTKSQAGDNWDFYWDSGFFWVTASTISASIETTLWEPTESGPCSTGDITVGRWGNLTVEPDAGHQDSVNFVRVKLLIGSSGAQFTVDWDSASWTSATTGDSIAINNNIEFLYFETTGTGTGFTGCDWGAAWTPTGTLSDGSHTFTFSNNAVSYIWIKVRIEDVGSPVGVATDYDDTWTSTLV